jgi:hypothetical protein
MMVATSWAPTVAARLRAASGSAARAARPFSRTADRDSVPSPSASLMRMTWARAGACARISATLAAWAALETKATLAWESFRM